MITIVQGVGVGAGKSYFLLIKLLDQVCAGGSVVVSDSMAVRWGAVKVWAEKRRGVILEDTQFRTFGADDTARLHEFVPAGTSEKPVLVLIDEAHVQLNARDWADQNKRAFFVWLTQSRHDDVDVVFCSQHRNNVDKQVMRLVTNIVNIRNMAFNKILGWGVWRPNQFRVNVYDQDGITQQDGYYLRKDKEIFALYDSKAMRGKRATAGEVLQPVKLKKKVGGLVPC